MKKEILCTAQWLLCTVAVHSANFSIPWHTVAGSAVSSTSADGRFSMSATAGAPAAGTWSGDGWDLFGSYWFPEAECDCRLRIDRRDNSVVVTWPATFRGCTLEMAVELRTGRTAWVPVTATLTGDTYTFIAPVGSDTQRFFRLLGL